jgi:polysaccharide export outer membrane protein
MKAFVARIGVACAVLSALLGCRSPQPPPPEFEAAPKEGVYIIGPADRLRIDVWQNDKLSLSDVPVRPDGKITVPLVDDIAAAGLTTDELKAALTEKLADYVQSPTVTVVVLSPLSKRAYVLGEVRNAGPISLGTDMSVLDAITAAGGFTAFAKKSQVRVLRRIDGKELDYVFNYDAFVSGRAPGTNVLLHPGDTVLVP